MPTAPAPRESSTSSSFSKGEPKRRPLFVLALPLLAVNLALAALFDLARHLPAALALLAAAFLWLAWAGRRLGGERSPGLGRRIVWTALVLRLPLLLLPPTLSDDVGRYLWDGRVAAAGFNPYLLAPADARLAALRGAAPLPPHAEVPTVYPPLAIAAFSIATRLPFPVFAWKAGIMASDLLACVLLLALARRRGVPEGRVALYAWNPLVMLEGAGMGHVDFLGVAAALVAVLALAKGEGARPPARGRGGPGVTAALGAAAAVLAKLVPAVALPMWARLSGAPGRFLTVVGVLVAAALLPVAVQTGGIPPGLTTLAVSWEWNGPLFEPLWRLLRALDVAPALARGLDALKEATGWYELPNPLYPYLYPQFLAKLLLAAGIAWAVARSLRERDAVVGTRRLFGRLLLFSSTVYPWYLVWVLPWAALTASPAWLALSALLLFSYVPQLREVPLFPWVYAAVWLPFAAVAAWERLHRRQEAPG